jgi:hypothetical protein
MSHCEGELRPRTFVPKQLSIDRRNWFIEKKYLPLVQTLQKHDVTFVYYPAVIFKNFLTSMLAYGGLRIYFASYSGEGALRVPQGYGGMMAFVFAPVINIAGTSNVVDKGIYYIINPSQLPETVPKPVANEWVHNFQSHKLPIFEMLPDFPPNGETKSILFERLEIEEIVKEITCQQATGVKIILTSYMDESNEPKRKEREEINGKGQEQRSEETEEYYNQLSIQFILTETINGAQQDFYIDDRPGWDTRKEAGASLDTGSPCPPASCGGISLPE